MDALRRDDLERARSASPETRAAQALEMMRFGIRLKRTSLRLRFPNETEEQIEVRLRRWLLRSD